MEDKKQVNHSGNERKKVTREERLRGYFDRMFGTNEQSKNLEKLMFFIRWGLFVSLVIVELLVLVEHLELFLKHGRALEFAFLAFLLFVLLTSEIAKMTMKFDDSTKHVFYMAEAGAACGINVLAGGSYALALYVLVLTQFYFSTKKVRMSLWIYGVGVSVFVISYIAQVFFIRGDITNIGILHEIFASIVAISLHYLAVQIVLSFSWQYLQLRCALDELDENKKELEKAYAAAADVAILEERQRIAREIHDTAGHSITTVIMQTESAKRIIETDPEEAKIKIVAANLQAKHTLVRLRESVHLLSGAEEMNALKTELEYTIQETMDGTDIHIRSDIDDIHTSREKEKFICRALKEGLSNGFRHGQATAFWFELKEEDGNICFLLSDNGKGLNGKKFQMGFGLLSMRDRVKGFGGKISFDSEGDDGFEIRFTIPLDTEE